MHRYQVVQGILDTYEEPAYLEVGVQDGTTFHLIKSPRKVAVDPVFQFDVGEALKRPENEGAAYHSVPSDDYFATAGSGEAFDVIYLDGLHTFDQTFRDLINALGVLKEGGTIILDDTVPSSYGASLPDESECQRFREILYPESPYLWMGDVYRLVFMLKDYYPQLSYATVNENHGQTVVWREQRPAPVLPRSVEAITRLSFAEMTLNRTDLNVLDYQAIVAALLRQRSR